MVVFVILEMDSLVVLVVEVLLQVKQVELIGHLLVLELLVKVTMVELVLATALALVAVQVK